MLDGDWSSDVCSSDLFAALRWAPPVEASLVNYLWPLLIVVLSGLLPGERLKTHHLLGAGLGLLGAAAVVTKGRGLDLDPAHVAGYLCAAGAAFVWSSYSVLSRRLAEAPTATVAGFCLATGVLSAACHAGFETTIWPEGWVQWGAVVALAIFPLGFAFFAWDHSVKRGDIQVLGAASYLSPLLSTLLLILAGWGVFTLPVAFAAVAITLGALIASKDLLFRRRPSAEA
jgi:drug/metabolite transporter (DMT)-like permease